MSLPRAWARAGAVAAPLLLCAVLAQAQGPPPRATVVRTPAPPALDGILDEPFWARSQPATGFWDNFPGDSTRSAYQTELRFASDEAHLYVAATCYAPGRDYVITSLKRDYRAGGNDNITFVFDPFGTGRNALVFGMNPLGVTREALISNGGVDPGDFQEAWDNKWRGESRIYDDRWVCEVAIPLRSLRYPADSLRWGFNAYRFDTQSNSRSTWNRIPRNQMIMSLAFMGELAWEQPPAKAGGAVTLIPFAAGSASRDFEGAPSGNTELTGGLGGDAKVAVSSGLNLDLTVNPDFSQVEVDRQVIQPHALRAALPGAPTVLPRERRPVRELRLRPHQPLLLASHRHHARHGHRRGHQQPHLLRRAPQRPTQRPLAPRAAQHAGRRQPRQRAAELQLHRGRAPAPGRHALERGPRRRQQAKLHRF